MAKNLMDMLKEGVVLGDGGMYLEANWRGYDVPEIIGSHPEALRQIHQDFFNAGSQVLQALTWFTSGAQLEAKYGWGDRVEEINRTGIRAAKEASNGEAPVGGVWCLRARGRGWEIRFSIRIIRRLAPGRRRSGRIRLRFWWMRARIF